MSERWTVFIQTLVKVSIFLHGKLHGKNGKMLILVKCFFSSKTL